MGGLPQHAGYSLVWMVDIMEGEKENGPERENISTPDEIDKVWAVFS